MSRVMYSLSRVIYSSSSTMYSLSKFEYSFWSYYMIFWVYYFVRGTDIYQSEIKLNNTYWIGFYHIVKKGYPWENGCRKTFYISLKVKNSKNKHSLGRTFGRTGPLQPTVHGLKRAGPAESTSQWVFIYTVFSLLRIYI